MYEGNLSSAYSFSYDGSQSVLADRSFAMTNDLASVQRHPFGPADHEQGSQSGDTPLASGSSLPFLMSDTVPSGRELLLLRGHTPPVIDRTAPPDSIKAFGDTYRQAVGALQEL